MMGMTSVVRSAAVAFLVCIGASTRSASTTIPGPADPLTAVIHADDVDRFAKLFAATGGHPTAEQIQTSYLDPGSYGVKVFTPDRIVDAAHLSAEIAKDPSKYRTAIDVCLPRLGRAQSDLRSIYLALHGLLPDERLPQIYVVIGAGNSGGTAGPGAQVLGLEVLCSIYPDEADFEQGLRRFFAHETVHTFQHEPKDAYRSPLLAEALTEGSADFIASLVTGRTPEPGRAAWAAPQEQKLWQMFQADIAAARPEAAKMSPAAARAATHRWLENYGSAPPGWPYEAGYWVGMRIWRDYYNQAADKHTAIQDMLTWDDPDLILKASGYTGGVARVPMTREISRRRE